MSYLETLGATSDGAKILGKYARASGTFNSCYKYWSEQLFERVMRLFVWENTDADKDKKTIDKLPKEIEQRLILKGHCGITDKLDSEPTAFFGSFYGVTKYHDEWSHYTVHCPVYTGQFEIGKNIVVIYNDALRNPIYPLIHHYSILLGHTDVTIINELINYRDSNGIPIAQTEKQKASIEDYQKKRFNGQYGAVTDIGALGIEYAGATIGSTQSLRDTFETREKILKSFYSDIGVRSAFEKKNNSVTAEVEADTSLLLLNLSDMLKYRQMGADAVNAMFGTNWSVHIAEEIDYGAENQRIQFDDASPIHVSDAMQNQNISQDGGVTK